MMVFLHPCGSSQVFTMFLACAMPPGVGHRPFRRDSSVLTTFSPAGTLQTFELPSSHAFGILSHFLPRNLLPVIGN